MNVKRYFAQTAREALRALKEELGADAIVLSNRAVEGGVEILALPADAVGAMQSPTKPAVAAPAPRAPAAPAPFPFDDDDFHVSLSGLAAGAIPRNATAEMPRRAAAEPAVRPQVIRPFTPPRAEPNDHIVSRRPAAPAAALRPAPLLDMPEPRPSMERPLAEPVHQPAATAPAASLAREAEDARVQALQETNARLMDELSGIRGMIERQLAGFAWGETRRHAPARATVVGELLEAGFSGPTARKLCEAVAEDATPEQARASVRGVLDRLLRARSSDDDIIDRGGVYALVGPTGVGKTTTTAKLAARCVVRHGASRLALITTDGYRIGAQEQLRIYGRILGVPVFSVRDAADLRQTLAELRGKHMVLIDTMGMSQRDKAVAEQAAMLTGAGDVRRLLLLNATCRGDTLDDVVRAYAGPELQGCIFTKVDEAASLAPAVDVAVRRKLDVFYVANGQRVPEDLHLPNRAYLLHRAMREPAAESPWRLQGDEAGLMLAAGGAGA
ncbi:flagellar biosynthesis protein FlhF [Azoarcus indigens]|uniref:Flagellar biosynthesis protein FlhF n=1 Tax=Azoarcus indigens TaxID=29545 RepID=A0A4R6DUQ4_9RHOO|nr:flagellar biosynthesis protein FlhF [Azoarcus indigens]NMG64401.1 flagellar biosynthesis protein FlhF [Azoarcus indigens]TDN48339.1 flagellar biosynthesis protein FlhF [Azoarcus indigens]